MGNKAPKADMFDVAIELKLNAKQLEKQAVKLEQ